MAEYVNSIRVTRNASKTEIFLNFSQDDVNINGEKEHHPVANLVMTGELAEQLLQLLSTALNETK